MLIRPDFRVPRFIVRVMQRRPSRNLAAVFLTLGGLYVSEIAVPSVANALHEPDHRFTVSGYVRNKEGKPIGDARVHVRDLRDHKIEGVTTYTNGAGYYKAVLHLHNDNAGDTIQVTAVEEKLGIEEVKAVRAEFNPSDLKSDRQVTINFGPVPERKFSAGAEYWQYLAGGALIAGAIGAVVWSRHRKAKAKAKRRGKKR